MKGLRDSDPSMILIYGALDLWTPCRLDTSAMGNSLTVVHDDAPHNVSIADLNEKEREAVEAKLREWLGASEG